MTPFSILLFLFVRLQNKSLVCRTHTHLNGKKSWGWNFFLLNWTYLSLFCQWIHAICCYWVQCISYSGATINGNQKFILKKNSTRAKNTQSCEHNTSQWKIGCVNLNNAQMEHAPNQPNRKSAWCAHICNVYKFINPYCAEMLHEYPIQQRSSCLWCNFI